MAGGGAPGKYRGAGRGSVQKVGDAMARRVGTGMGVGLGAGAGASSVNVFPNTPGMVTVDLAEWQKLNAFYYSNGGGR